MFWVVFAFSGPVLWAMSVHLDKYLAEPFFKQSNVAVMLFFTAFVGLRRAHLQGPLGRPDAELRLCRRA